MIEVASTTEIGNRSENQDASQICELQTGTLAVLADGAGGHQDGALAAQSLCQHLTEAATRHVQQIAGITYCRAQESEKAGATRQLIRQVIAQAASAMGEEVRAANPQTNAHTTLVLCWASASVTLIANIGDSRAYRVDGSGVECLSRDHSMTHWMLEKGEITEEQAQNHAQRNRLYRMVSTDRPAKPSINIQPALRGKQCVLLCSDGWWEQITTQEMLTLGQQEVLEPWLDHHASTAVKRAGGRSDNVTAVALRIS